MDPHVSGNLTLCYETLPTNITLELPQASVSQCVLVEVRIGGEFLATLQTFIIFNTTVCQGVCGKVTLPSKFLATLQTFIIFNTTVCQGVFGEVITERNSDFPIGLRSRGLRIRRSRHSRGTKYPRTAGAVCTSEVGKVLGRGLL